MVLHFRILILLSYSDCVCFQEHKTTKMKKSAHGNNSDQNIGYFRRDL